ncbi:MAG TPA: hypothetical protein VFR37_02655, partial [Longimicrobium sp.]|nr:hypothetical protein [Longimicrobium sp.]
MNSSTWMQVAALLYLLLSLGVLWGVFVGLRGIVRLLVGSGETGKRSLLGGDARTRLLGLAITAIIFTPLLGRLVRSLIRLSILLFDRVPRHMLARWRTQSDFCGDAGANCLTDTVLVLVNATAGGISAAVRDSGILGIGVGYVVLWLALWVLATALLNTVKANADAGEPFDMRGLLLGSNHEVTRKNLLFFTVLFVGAYLSLASIAAIPDLRGELDTSSPSGMRDVNRVLAVKGDWDVRYDTVPNPLRLVDSVFYPALAALAPDDAAPPTSPAAPVDTTVRMRPRTPAGGGQPAADSVAADSAAAAADTTADTVAALAAPRAGAAGAVDEAGR